MEELVLTDPVVVPEKVTNKYRVSTLTLSLEMVIDPGGAPGAVIILLRDNHNVQSSYQYLGQTAVDMVKWLNTANLTIKSMHKRILERLAADGYLPGTVTAGT